MYGIGWQKLVHPDDLQYCVAKWMSALQTGEGYDVEFRLRRRDGTYRWHLGRAVPLRDADGQLIKWFGTNTDIEDQKRIEEELRRSQERFELAVQGSQDGLWDWNLVTDEVYYSPQYKAIIGYEDHEFPNKREEWAKRVHPDDYQRLEREILAHIKGTTSHTFVEFRFRHKDGSYRWMRSRAFVLRDANGRVYRMSGSHQDVTDQKAMEEELARLRTLVQQAGLDC